MTYGSRSFGLLALALLALSTLTASATPPTERLQRLDRELQDTSTRLAQGKLSNCDEVRAATEDLELDLRSLRHEVQEASALAAKVEALRPVLGNLLRAQHSLCAAAGTPSPQDLATPSRLEAPDQDSTSVGLFKAASEVPGADTCEAAPGIQFGSFSGDLQGATQSGSSTCGGTGDAWYRIEAADSFNFLLDTLGSDFDTVLSIHTECPGTLANQRSCNDDAYGLQSALAGYVYSGETLWLRISSADGSSGRYQLNYGTGGTIEGRVTAEESGTPLAGVFVQRYENGYFRSSTVTDANGDYQLGTGTNLAVPEFHLLAVAGSGYADELYEDQPCYDLCEVEAATSVQVSVGTTISGIDFDLPPEARIEGRVSEVSGAGLRGVNVRLWDSEGRLLEVELTDVEGRYVFDKLPQGTYYLGAFSSLHVGQLHGGIDCPEGAFEGCSPSSGTPVTVVAGQVAQVDFQLVPLGSISGTVLDPNGKPVAGTTAHVLTLEGSLVTRAWADSQGAYIARGLPTGQYLVWAEEEGYIAQLYDGLVCESPASGECDLQAATRIAVEVGQETAGIDFRLRDQGRISGTVTDPQGALLTNMPVAAYDAAGERVASTKTDSLGRFRFAGLSPGSYRIVTGASPYLFVVYPDVLCPGRQETCPLGLGSPIELKLGAHVTGIDLQLTLSGRLYGRVSDASGAALSNWVVQAVATNTGEVLASSLTTPHGSYNLQPLASTPVYLRTQRCFFCTFELLNEVYPDLVCPTDDSCPFAQATAITPQLGTSLGSFDFQLSRTSIISGTVYALATGTPLANPRVELWDQAGNRVSSSTFSEGSFLFYVFPGAYTVSARDDFHQGEVFDRLRCPFDDYKPLCNVTLGTVFEVTTDQTFSQVDFHLTPRQNLVPLRSDDFEHGSLDGWIVVP